MPPDLVPASCSDVSGVRTLSTHGPNGWAEWDGTSFATPLVAGGAALLLEKYPGLTPPEVKAALAGTAQPFGGTPDPALGAGVLDLQAVAAVLTTDRGSLRLVATPGGAALTWSPVLNATSHDVVRGAVEALRLAGAVVDLGTLTCIADDVAPGTPLLDAAAPGPGQAFFYLVRDNAPDAAGGSYGSASTGQLRQPGAMDCAP
jgi:subtilisin family serine protease